MGDTPRHPEFAPPEVFSSLEQQLEKLERSDTVKHITPEYIDTKVMSVNLAELVELSKSKRNNWKKGKIEQDTATIKIDSDFPLLLVFLGDIHFGSVYVDYDRFNRDYHNILDTPNAYVILMSNLIDNFLPTQFPDHLLMATMTPEEQVIAMRRYVMDLDSKGKILGAVISPCHEGWTFKKAGQNINKLLFGYEGRTFPILDNGGKLLLNLGELEYYIALYHQIGPFNSNLNKNNGTQRMLQLHHPKADIVAAAHHHTAEAMATYYGREELQREVAFLRTGTYKLDDSWAKGRGYIGGEPSAVSVMIYPETKRLQPYLDLNMAIEAQQGICLGELLKRKK